MARNWLRVHRTNPNRLNLVDVAFCLELLGHPQLATIVRSKA